MQLASKLHFFNLHLYCGVSFLQKIFILTYLTPLQFSHIYMLCPAFSYIGIRCLPISYAVQDKGHLKRHLISLPFETTSTKSRQHIQVEQKSHPDTNIIERKIPWHDVCVTNLLFRFRLSNFCVGYVYSTFSDQDGLVDGHNSIDDDGKHHH